MRVEDERMGMRPKGMQGVRVEGRMAGLMNKNKNNPSETRD